MREEQKKQQLLAALRQEKIQQKVESNNATATVYTPPDVPASEQSKPVQSLKDLIYSDNASALEQAAKEKYNSYPSNYDRLRDFPVPY